MQAYTVTSRVPRITKNPQFANYSSYRDLQTNTLDFDTASLEVHCSSSRLSGAYFITTLLTGIIRPLPNSYVSLRVDCF